MGLIAELSPEAFAEVLKTASPAEKPALLRARFREKPDEFCKALWPERFGLEFNALHHWLFAKQSVPPWYLRTEDIKEAIAAPRGFAKSTIENFGKLAHDIVYDREAFIVIVTAESKLGLDLSTDLRNQFLKENADSLLHRLYGPFKVVGGVTGWQVSVQGRLSVGVMPVSTLGQIRGKKHPTRGIRPTKVILDDSEKPERVRNPDQRKNWWDWFTKDVLKVGRREKGTIYRMIGTVLHVESGLAKLLKKIGWDSRRWQAVITWPVRLDLWDKCKAIWCDLSLGEGRVPCARAFYERWRVEMDEGAEVLDPASKSLFELFEIMWAEGRASFFSELQNDPIDPDTQVFISDRFKRFRIEAGCVVIGEAPNIERIPLERLRKYGYWDPATGSAFGDFAAIAILGRDEWGRSYVLDVWMRRAKPHEQLEAAWKLSETWKCKQFTVEANGFQQLVAEPYARELRERRQTRKWWMLDLVGDKTHEDKEMKLSTLEPDCANGWLAFNVTVPEEVFMQFDQFPTGDHDDGMDAIHGAWSNLGGNPVGMAE